MSLREVVVGLVFAAGLASARPALPATLLVTSPHLGLCVTSQDAKYQYSWGALRPETGLFSYFLPGQAPLAPRIDAPRTAKPGDLVRIEVQESEDLDSFTAQIIGPRQQTMSQGIGFRPLQSQKDRWVVLLGVSAVTGRGTYTLLLTVKAGDRSAVQLSPFSVNERPFRFEQIVMSEGMETLRTTNSARRIAEARELIRAVTTPHADAVFETGLLRNPLPNARRTSGYGDRRKYLFPDNRAEYSVHEGLDLAEPQGTPVPSCGRGRVVLAAERVLTGNTVVVEMLPGLYSLYLHLSEIDVKVGDVVGQGDLIGRVGMTGFATGPHLHWEIDAFGVPVDPDSLTAGPILDKTAESGEIETGKASKGGE